MMGGFGRGLVLVKASFGVVRKDPELMAYPVISATLFILLFMMMMGIIVFTPSLWSEWMIIATFLLLTFGGNFLMIFSNVALIGAATIRLKGGNPTLADGFRVAGQNIGSIVVWALVSTFVSLALRALRRRGGLAGAVASSILGMAWGLLTFFIIPVLIYEKRGVWESLKRSGRLFRENWGETLTGGFGIGIIFMLLALAGFGILLLAIFMFSTFEAVLVALVAVVIYWAILAVFFTAVDGVFTAAMYRYATTGKLEADFEHVGHFIPRPHAYTGGY